MLKILRWSPKQECAGHVCFRKFGRQFKRAAAVKLGFFQPRVNGVKFKMPRGAGERKQGRGERKSGVSGYRNGQMLARLIHHRRITAGRKAVASHELCVGQWISAVTRSLLFERWR